MSAFYIWFFGALAIVVIALVQGLPGSLKLSPVSPSDLPTLFAPFMFVSLLKERAIDILLNAFLERPVFGPVNEKHRKMRLYYSTLIGLVIGLTLSFLGFRTIEPLFVGGDVAKMAPWQLVLLRSLDIFMTTVALMGGAEFFHFFAAGYSSYMEAWNRRQRQ